MVCEIWVHVLSQLSASDHHPEKTKLYTMETKMILIHLNISYASYLKR